MKKNKLPKSSEKDDKENEKHKKRAEYSSMVCDYENLRKSLGATSPRQTKFAQKYKTYMEFITTNKICQDVKRNINSTFMPKKNTVSTTPRKNSPIPYHKGRKSAFSRIAQSSPHNRMGSTQRSSFPKTTRQKNNSFYIHGNNYHQRKNSNESKRSKKMVSRQPEQKNIIRQLSKQRQKSWGQKAEAHRKKNGNQNYRDKKNAPKKSKGKKKEKSSINKESIESQRDQTYLDLEERKLFEKSFKGIQFYRDLGKGAHALVKSAVDWNNKRKIAVKIYEKNQLTEQELNSIERQIEILLGLTHPNIIKLYEIIETFKTINLVMEYGGGNSLEQYVKSKPNGFLSQKQGKQIFRQTLDAVGYLHKMHITHRDIKTENILLNKHLNLKIIDFGFSLICGSNKNINSYCGTPTYMAPQVVSKTPHNPQLSDRWSLGILLYTILNGHCPFRASTQKDLFQIIIKGEFSYEVQISEEAKDLINRFLKKNPNDRISPQDALNHPWFNS